MDTGHLFTINIRQANIEGIRVRLYKPADKDLLMFMIFSLYREDNSSESMNENKIENTIERLSQNSNEGLILILENNSQVIGYTILINYWSNEFGGNIVCIDELFILPEYRNKGIASSLIRQLIEMHINNSIAIQLEVTPNNPSAARLYERIGFISAKNKFYRYFPIND